MNTICVGMIRFAITIRLNFCYNFKWKLMLFLNIYSWGKGSYVKKSAVTLVHKFGGEIMRLATMVGGRAWVGDVPTLQLNIKIRRNADDKRL